LTDYNPGDIVRVQTYSGTVGAPEGGFRNSAGALADPTTVTLLWRRHGEADTTWIVTAGQIVKEAEGLYHADITVAEPGLHYFRWVGTGAIVAAEEGTFSATSAFIVGVP
jgi:hypothetical protein